MRVSVIIPSVGRPAVLHDTVTSVLDQSLAPVEVILSLPGREHVQDRTLALPGVRCVEGPKGLCAQRNSGVRALDKTSDLVVFFDDDVELDRDYLAVMSAAFVQNQDMVAANGQLVADGGSKHRMQRAEARQIIEQFARDASAGSERRLWDTSYLYGCHFAVRRFVFDTVHFDERLPFYGWLEDIDFGRNCQRLGRVCCVDGARVVHLAERSGRTSGLRFGFSQVMNPAYLKAKGNFSSADCRRHWKSALASNLVGTLILDRTKRERLVGNLMAIGHLVRGQIDPEFITKL
jgi:GT2 family glycosyltransferase